MRADVEASRFRFLADAQADGHRNEHQQDQADDQRIGGTGADAVSCATMLPSTPPMAIDANTPVSSEPTMPPTA